MRSYRERHTHPKEDAQMNSITAGGGLMPGWMSSGMARQVISNARNHLEEWQQAWQALSPTDQAALTQAGQQAVQTLTSLTPQQKQEVKQTLERLVDTVQQMTPDQRAQLAQQIKQAAQHAGSLTVQQRQALLTQIARSTEQTGSPFSPSQKAQFLASYGQAFGL
jgi:L-fucose mutarotase/ribose pyranase (RbsD/FucU family)